MQVLVDYYDLVLKCSVLLRICIPFLFLDALHSFMLDDTED